ncbi:hypothetical protein K490DRAFT_57123 [Saccharata proteae CBS 121410]|uniref:Uncharacterized protein n=1 Tax=Saccharata proteae CBS 121410 TaxID=1314787 RepID=A0A9P4LWH1_9PEZI|nr:hypothetical protein K490DRAFT_57123 [Saccharata proteae CBS 121410]
MSATRTNESTMGVSNQEGQVGSHVPRSEPMTTHGHKPGVQASEADKAPEFHAKTVPPGTAPASATYQPNPTNEVPPVASNPSASSTIGGATSADVHTGLGHPGQGMTSQELHGDGHKPGSKARSGLAGVGASVGTDSKIVSGREPEFAKTQRAIDEDVPSGTRGKQNHPGAEERLPESADTVAHEAPKGR